MPKLKLDVRVYEDSTIISKTEIVVIEFEGYELCELVSDYINDLLLRRALANY